MNMKAEKQKAERRGRNAEMLSVLLLRVKGYKVLEQRYRCAAGEIDIIAHKGKMYVFIEVKARKNNTLALESVTEHQRGRIESAAEIWLQNVRSHDFAVRFDVIAVAPRQLPNHMIDAWRPGW